MVFGKNKRRGTSRKRNINRKILIFDIKIRDGNHTIDEIDNLNIGNLMDFLNKKYK